MIGLFMNSSVSYLSAFESFTSLQYMLPVHNGLAILVPPSEWTSD